jgi:hypothetical protein
MKGHALLAARTAASGKTALRSITLGGARASK